jgi:hypothetical protein
MNLAELYLSQRGLSRESTQRFGLEIESPPKAELFLERLGIELPRGVETILWIPVLSKAGAIVSWIARLLPQPQSWPKFVCTKNSGGPPWILPELYDSEIGCPLMITEAPIKAMAITLAGYDAIGLNGVWCAAGKKNNGGDPLTLRPELQSLHLLGRKIYLAFDADQDDNAKVRQALIRLYLLLGNEGSEVYQLTTWNVQSAVGIDDYLAAQKQQSSEALKRLVSNAKPFIQTLRSSSPLDASLVQKELPQIDFGPIVLDQLSRQLAKALGVQVEVLRNLAVGPAKPKPELSFAANYERWPEPVDAQKLFIEIMHRIGAEVNIEEHQEWICALWIMFTWVHPQMEFSPILYVTGPTMECGKTSLLNVIGKMVRRPVKTANVSPAAIFRLSELYHPTFLMDEAQDQLKNPDFWLVIKSGHTPGEYAIRCDANTNEPLTFDVFCPKMLAGIGRANGQIMSRSILIEMERRASDSLDRSIRESDPVFIEIRRKLARWANDASNLSRFRLPKDAEVKMRNRDNWQALYRVACALSAQAAEALLRYIPSFIDEEQDYATYLLDSLRKLYREHNQMTKDGFLGSEAIVNALNQDGEAPWYAKDDMGLTVRALSDRLKRYKVKPEKIWQSEIDKQVRGYRYIDSRSRHNDLKRVFDQYLPAEDFK